LSWALSIPCNSNTDASAGRAIAGSTLQKNNRAAARIAAARL
jgi:hypothetical protein